MASAESAKVEELPHDGTCDACEPDEANKGVRVCEDCHFNFCLPHAEEHSRKYVSHRLRDFVPGCEENEGAMDINCCNESVDTAAGESTPAKASSQDEETFEKKKCLEHSQDLTLYCKEHEQIICVLCAVTGAHKEHQLITLNEAYEIMRSREPLDLREAMLEMVERLKDKCSDPNVTRSEMKTFITQQFERMRDIASEEERKALHLVDLQEAMETARVSEVLAELNVRMMNLMTEMAEITNQLSTFNELALLKPEDVEMDSPSAFRQNRSPPRSPPRSGNSRHCDHPPPANGPW